MAIAVLMETHGFTLEQIEAVRREMGVNSIVSGELIHLEGPLEGGFRVVDVWESQAAYEAFITNQVLPAIQRLGLSLPEDFKPVIWPVTTLYK